MFDRCILLGCCLSVGDYKRILLSLFEEDGRVLVGHRCPFVPSGRIAGSCLTVGISSNKEWENCTSASSSKDCLSATSRSCILLIAIIIILPFACRKVVCCILCTTMGRHPLNPRLEIASKMLHYWSYHLQDQQWDPKMSLK